MHWLTTFRLWAAARSRVLVLGSTIAILIVLSLMLAPLLVAPHPSVHYLGDPRAAPVAASGDATDLSVGPPAGSDVPRPAAADSLSPAGVMLPPALPIDPVLTERVAALLACGANAPRYEPTLAEAALAAYRSYGTRRLDILRRYRLSGVHIGIVPLVRDAATDLDTVFPPTHDPSACVAGAVRRDDIAGPLAVNPVTEFGVLVLDSGVGYPPELVIVFR